jgi:hypothetical protein
LLVNWNPTIFDDKDTVYDFTNQLLPQQQGGLSTQPQAAANPLVPPRRAAGAAAAAAGGGVAAAAAVGAAAMPPIGIVPQVQMPPPPQQWGGGNVGGLAPGGADYSGIKVALQRLRHTMYDPATIDAELGVQSAVVPGDSTSCAGFRDFVANVQQLWVYLAMLRGQAHVTMIHTPGVYYSIKSLTSAYQGKMMAFIGNPHATKEPKPVCLPTTKAWEWHTGDAIADVAKAEAYYSVEVNRGTLWTSGATDSPLSAMTVLNLLAIPNALVDLLHKTRSGHHPT